MPENNPHRQVSTRSELFTPSRKPPRLFRRIGVAHVFFGEALCLTAHARSVISSFVMKPLIFALWIVFACGGLNAQTNVWQPSPGHTQVPIWPGRCGCAACPGAGVCYERAADCRRAMGCGMQRLAAYDDGLFVKRNEYGCCGSRVSRRRLQLSGHGS